MRQLVHDFLRASAGRCPDKVFLVGADSRLTFGDVETASDRLARRLQSMGFGRGDRATVFMDNSPDTIVAVFGILKAGGVFTVVNPTTKARKLAYMLNDSGSRVLIAQASLAPVVEQVRGAVPSLIEVVWSGAVPLPGVCLSTIVAESGGSPADPGLIDNDLCTIIYTSGSTGDPKGVMLTHRNMSNTAWSISTYLGNVPDDVVIGVLPFSFDYGLYQVLTGARVGFSVVIEKSFAYPFQLIKRMQQERVTGLPGVPTIFATLLGMEAFRGEELPSLRYVTNTAAAFPPAHIRRIQDLFPKATVFSMYGLTECTRVSYLDPARLHDKIASVGKAIPNEETYIVDEQGRRVGPNVIGELVIRGANVMRGYWGKPEATAERLRDGEILGEKVLHAGDLFYKDEEGFLYFVGRKDDVFKCKGEKISPREIENVLYELDSVAEAAVVGVDDPIDGQAVKAFVVPRNGCTLEETQIRQHCRAHLENYMVPKFIEICGALPKTDSGKIRKTGLADRADPDRRAGA